MLAILSFLSRSNLRPDPSSPVQLLGLALIVCALVLGEDHYYRRVELYGRTP